jgi:hypothetical protein
LTAQDLVATSDFHKANEVLEAYAIAAARGWVANSIKGLRGQMGEGQAFRLRNRRFIISPMTWTPWRFMLVAIAGWTNRQQQDVIAYLTEENRILRESGYALCPSHVPWYPCPA